MMFPQKNIATFLVILLTGFSAFSHSNVKEFKYGPKIFWTKTILAASSDCKIRVDQNGIVSEMKRCDFDGHVSKGQKVTLKRSVKQKGWMKLFLEDDSGKKEFQIFVKNDTKQGFSRIFNMLFAQKETGNERVECPAEGETKLQILKKIGFPDSITNEGNKEWFNYTVNHTGGPVCGGFDSSTIELEKGRIVRISGNI
ncbi:MAG TPA: hypothetical protein VGO50_18225 [Pyrinomonadaceae bacterium]|jgi:hypothetical protein|nr:hypothetical protein [Pyrinomonadaceae bacterium]